MEVTMKRDRDRQTVEWQYTTSTLCPSNPQVYMRWKGTLTSNDTQRGDQPLPPASSKCKKVITGLKKANKYGVMHVP